MGNRLSTKGSLAAKKKKRGKSSKKKLKDENGGCQYERHLEIEDFCPIEEKQSSDQDYKTKSCGSRDCKKALWHEDYKEFESLTLEDFPEPIKHPTVLDYVEARGNVVVCILVSKKSPARGSKNPKFGHRASGYARVCEEETVKMPCPIPNCKLGNAGGRDNGEVGGTTNHNFDDAETMNGKPHHDVYGGIMVRTNRHVILDEFECENSEFYFFFDSGRVDQCKVKGHGHCLRDDSSEKNDYVGVNIYFHDARFVDKIRQLAWQAEEAWDTIPPSIQSTFEDFSVVVSHPHGWPKQVSFGRLLEKETLLDDDDESDGEDKHMNNNNSNKAKKKRHRVSRYTSITCEGSSGSPVLTGFYWTNPFVHSTGIKLKKSTVGMLEWYSERDRYEVWGESYFY